MQKSVIMDQFQMLVHQVMKVDGGEWDLGTSLGIDWYSGGSCLLPSVLIQYYHSSCLKGQRESQTTLLSLWDKTRTWDSPNIKDDTTHSNVTLRYL
jgi:hypothetical protein